MTKGSFYHHNDTKHDLISACFERSFGVVRDALHRAAESPGSGWSRACAAARALVLHQVGESGPLLRTSATSALPERAHREQVRLTLQRLTERFGGLVVEGMMDGSIRPLDPAVFAQGAFAAINAAAAAPMVAALEGADDIVDVYVRPVFEGVLCGAPEERREA